MTKENALLQAIEEFPFLRIAKVRDIPTFSAVGFESPISKGSQMSRFDYYDFLSALPTVEAHFSKGNIVLAEISDEAAEVFLPKSNSAWGNFYFDIAEFVEKFERIPKEDAFAEVALDKFVTQINGFVPDFRKPEEIELKIPDTIHYIQSSAFEANYNLKKVIFPDTIRIIGEKAFADCTRLEEAIFTPSSTLSIISDSAFANCSSLKKIELTAGIYRLGDSAFAGCKNLQSLVIYSREFTSIGRYAFSGCINLSTITYDGYIEDFAKIKLDKGWNDHVPAAYVKCQDGEFKI